MKILFKLNQSNQQRQQEKQRWIYPINLAMYATYLRNRNNQVVWDGVDDGTFDRVITSEGQIDVPFLGLPHADRILTDAMNPKWQRNGNFKHHPGAYLLSASGCVWGKCTFCVEKDKLYEVRPVDDVIEEIKICKSQNYRELFDDSATFPTGAWLEEFCVKVRPLDVTFSCNMRFGALSEWEYWRLGKSRFRMLLYGLESANQDTLDKINKGIVINEAIEELKLASSAGLEPHICVIFGYPWETDEDAIRTLKLVHHLLRKGYAKTAQASLYNGERQEFQKYIPQIYRAALYPDFWINKLKDIKDVDDIKYIWRGVKSCFGK